MTIVLSKSPLIYVLGQVKISPILKIEDYINDIQELLRDELPDLNIVTLHEIQVQDGNPSAINLLKQWHFSNLDKTYGVLVQKDAITIHTTHYDTFEGFSNIFRNALSKIHQVLKISAYNRIGIRYINLISENIDEYVNKQLLGFRLNSSLVNTSDFFNKTDTINDTEHGMMKIQAIHTVLSKIPDEARKTLLPPDLLPTAELVRPKTRNEPNANFVILDIDHFTTTNSFSFNSDEIISKLTKLNSCVFDAFTEAVTDKAIDAWR